MRAALAAFISSVNPIITSDVEVLALSTDVNSTIAKSPRPLAGKEVTDLWKPRKLDKHNAQQGLIEATPFSYALESLIATKKILPVKGQFFGFHSGIRWVATKSDGRTITNSDPAFCGKVVPDEWVHPDFDMYRRNTAARLHAQRVAAAAAAAAP